MSQDFHSSPSTIYQSASWRVLFMLALGGYGLALWHGHLEPAAWLWIAALLVCGIATQQTQAWLRPAGHIGFVILAIALALHILPGFANARIWHEVTLGPGSIPYTFYLNLDKPLAGLWLLLACPWIVGQTSWRASAKTTLFAAPITVLACLSLALLLGLVAWQPHWPAGAWLWAATNLLLVCLVEEALFRGYVQGGLHRCGGILQQLALPIAAILFGLAHLAGGWPWVLLATVAGLGYGWAYRQGGLLASVTVHFALNLTHFALFTYPMLSR